MAKPPSRITTDDTLKRDLEDSVMLSLVDRVNALAQQQVQLLAHVEQVLQAMEGVVRIARRHIEDVQ